MTSYEYYTRNGDVANQSWRLPLHKGPLRPHGLPALHGLKGRLLRYTDVSAYRSGQQLYVLLICVLALLHLIIVPWPHPFLLSSNINCRHMAVTLNMTLTTVTGHARSPDLSPIDRPYTSFCRHSVVSLALDCFVSEMSLLLYHKCHFVHTPPLSLKIWRCSP